MLDNLIHFDQQLLLTLNGSDSVFWDGFWMTITRIATWLLFYVAIIFVMLRSYGVKHVVLILFMVGLAILLADQGASGICKPLVHRFRPTHEPLLTGLVDIVDGYRGGKYGFMSSHAANGFAICTLVSLIIRYRWATVTMFIFASLSSFSRIYLGLHYPGDILCGGLWGVICGFIAYWLYSIIAKRMNISKRFYSDAYTKGGILKADANIVPLAYFTTLIYALVRALFYAINH